MSNIQQTVNFLKQQPDKHFITVTDQETSKPIGLSKIYLKDIPNEDLKAYIKFNVGQTSNSILCWVELRKENGTSSQKVGSHRIEIMPDFPPVNNAIPVTPASVVHEAAPMANQMLGNPFGLGLPELLKMNTDAAMLEEVKRQLAKAEEDNKQLKHENRTLEIDLREQKTKVATAEQQKELAVMLATAGQKGFFDGEGFQKLLEKAPDMLEKIAAMKAGASGEVSTLGNPTYNKVQKDFIDYLVDNLSDEQITGLSGICFYMRSPEFTEELSALIDKYKEQ